MSTAKEEFVRHLEKLVAGAIRQVKQAHGEILVGSVARRIATQLWGQGLAKAHANEADWVRHVRGMLGLTQSELAQRLSTTQVTVARWESARSRPAPYYQRAIEALARGSSVPVA